ncbi:MAG: bifunctional diaminohydroxyphosphoribosylaminopyrimidine deaminase/5-amino-6-(5-phosphoribosylamino)uracil reductase RibD [Chloroflexota bacterium]
MNYMEQALSLARLALGQVSPNPAVGALVVKDDEVIGKGYTQPPGCCHAEVVALEQAGDEANGSTMYVTLEPCCHYGKTPPCSSAIVTAGVKEVHMAMLDPNPIVSGKGKEELEAAGVRVYIGEYRQEARDINEAYIKYITTGMPFITAKYAMSLDGKIATHSGDSKWISNEESRHYAHHLRCINDAIMVGVNTVLADDPHLTSRCGGGRGGTTRKQPLRVIIDSDGRTPKTARLFQETGETLLVMGRQIKPQEIEDYTRLGAEPLAMSSTKGYIDLKKLFKILGEREITSVLVEGGSILLGSVFDQGLVDKVVVFVAPIIIGGEKAKTAVAGKGVDKVLDSFKLKRINIERFEQDIMISGYVAAGSKK